ncbi:MAG: MFS transporter [Bryobacteraceae bacterium]|nr:MFS transporter [Bryobacteraceae bacterium]
MAVLTPLAQGLWSLCSFRFLLGIGEAGNWPGAAKVVAERFPPRERALGVAIYDSGSAVGAAAAPFIVLGLLQFTGSWRAALAIPGILGFLWILCWRQVAGRAPVPAATKDATAANWPAPLGQLLRRSDTWGIMLGRTLTDPVWFFVTDWFAIYLVSKQIRLEEGVLAFWIPFIAADAGNFLGGGISSLLVGRGWDPVTARKAIIGVTGLGMTAIGLAIFTSNLLVLTGLFSLATCCYAAWSTMALTLPADIYPGNAVASVSGLGGALSGAGTMLATFLIGRISDRYSFEPVLVAASLIPLVATSVVMLFVRNRKGAVANV